MPAEPLTVPGRFNGPRDSGNGGYSCGIFSRLIDGPAEVSLRAPVPLDTELGGELRDGGVDVLADGDMIARVEPADELDLEVPETVNLDEAREGSKLYRGVEDGPFSHCFVCGLSRPDAYGVFAGEVEGKRVVASPWTPRDRDGGLRRLGRRRVRLGGPRLPDLLRRLLRRGARDERAGAPAGPDRRARPRWGRSTS